MLVKETFDIRIRCPNTVVSVINMNNKENISMSPEIKLLKLKI